MPPEHIRNLWAPWRMSYVADGAKESADCFLCEAARDPSADNLVVTRTDHCVVVMNRFPYNNGHVLVAPRGHLPRLGDLDTDTRLDMLELVDRLQAIVADKMKADGFNVGFNIGRAAGAGLPGHLHLHLVPRWQGDTNFMPLLADVNVIPQHIEETRRLLSEGLARD
jgi:ATP adenylyltransferase